MRIHTLLFAALLSVAGRGFASDITINLDAPNQLLEPGRVIAFTGTIVNNDPAIVDLNSIDVNLSGIGLSMDDTAFFSGPLAVGASTGLPLTQTIDFEMFGVSIAANAPLGTSIGTVAILGAAEGLRGYDPTTQNVLGSATFRITVVPEPSTFAITLMAAGALYLLRRRATNAQAKLFRGSTLWLALALGTALAQTPAPEQCALPRSPAKNASDEAVAVVAGQPILKSDLDDAVKSSMMALRNQEFQIKSKVLDDLIRRRVVESEAKKQGVTVDQLYAKEVDARIPTPPDAEVYAYYLGIRAQLNKPFKEVRAQLQSNLKALEIQQMRDDYVDYLRGTADVSVMFQPPRVAVDYDRSRLRGDANAPVTIVEFADYQCPYCEKVEASVRELLEKYPGKVNVAYRDFPLTTIHPYAQKASEAARCAGKQGKFWQYHDALFDAQAKLDEFGLQAQAHTLGLDEKAFSACMESGEFAKDVARDQEDGKKAGISSTPGFFIDGIFLNGAQPVAEFEKIIDSELRSGANQTASGSLR